MKRYSGQILRRMSLIWTRDDGARFNVLTIVECIEPDMSDYDFSPNELVSGTEGHFEIQVEDSAIIENWESQPYLWIEKAGITESVDYRRMPKDSHHDVLSREFDSTRLTNILPFRQGPYYVIRYADCKSDRKELLDNPEFGATLSLFSQERLGYDLASYLEYLGSIVMVWHHTVIRDISLTATDNPPGMFCTISTRKPSKMELMFKITDRTKDGDECGYEEIHTSVEARKCLLKMKKSVTRPDVEVFDMEGQKVFSMKGISFIRQIVLNMGVVDGVTGKKETEWSRDVIASRSSKNWMEPDRQREQSVNKIIRILDVFGETDQQLIMDEVRKRMEGKR